MVPDDAAPDGANNLFATMATEMPPLTGLFLHVGQGECILWRRNDHGTAPDDSGKWATFLTSHPWGHDVPRRSLLHGNCALCMMLPKQHPIQPATAPPMIPQKESDGLESGHTQNAAERHGSAAAFRRSLKPTAGRSPVS